MFLNEEFPRSGFPAIDLVREKVRFRNTVSRSELDADEPLKKNTSQFSFLKAQHQFRRAKHHKLISRF